MRRIQYGFTAVELVVVIVLLGILAVYAAPRFAGRGVYSELTVQQELIQSLRFAQQLAMARTSDTVTLVTSASAIDVRSNSASLTAYGYPKSLPSDVPLSARTLTFDRFGAAGLNAKLEISITGSAQTLKVCVEPTTGYAHDC